MSQSGGRDDKLPLEERVLRFGAFRFVPESGELFREGDAGRVSLGPKATSILGVLAEHPGRLVTRERLYEAAWPDTVVEFDQALNACIRQIRRALGDNARAPRYIETIPRRGYRFLLPMSERVAPAPEPHPYRIADSWRRPVAAWAASTALVSLAALGATWGSHRSPPGPALARVEFDVVSPALAGLDREMEQHVRRQVRLLVATDRDARASESFYLTGTLTEQEDGALLRALLVRARDGRIVWSGSFNPLCDRAASDPKPLIGAYLARVLSQS